MDNRLLYYIWLGEKLYPGSLSPKILLEQLGDIEKIYRAERDELASFGITPGDIERLCDKDLTDASRYYEFCASERVGILCYDNAFYPERLKNIPNPPPLFYYKGRMELLDDYPLFAMVGTRSCTEAGFRIAYETGYRAAARGAVPINGIASGIDAAVLWGALDADGYAVALLGNGIERAYPASNAELFRKMTRRGLIMSEFPPYTEPAARNFPTRNRCISGLSLGTVIFEAEATSGAVHTTTHALSQGRRIYAVPGEIGDKMYSASFSLIRDGAVTVTSADDFVMEFADTFPHRIEKGEPAKIPLERENTAVAMSFGGNETQEPERRTLPKPAKPLDKPKKKKKPEKAKTVSREAEEIVKFTEEELSGGYTPPAKFTSDEDALSPCEKAIFRLFDSDDKILTVDDIVCRGMKPDDVLSSLTLLEIFGLVVSLPGGRYKKIIKK